MLATCLATAAGGFVLDKHCIEGDVLYAALEDGQRRLTARLEKVCAARTWPARLPYCTEIPNQNEGGLEFLSAWVARSKYTQQNKNNTNTKNQPTTTKTETQNVSDY